MSRWFNISGPCQEDIHYMLSPIKRLPDLEDLIQQRISQFSQITLTVTSVIIHYHLSFILDISN